MTDSGFGIVLIGDRKSNMADAEFNLLIAGMRSKAELEIEKIYKFGSYDPKSKKCIEQPTSVIGLNAFSHKIDAAQDMSGPKHHKTFLVISNRLDRMVSADKKSTLRVQLNCHSKEFCKGTGLLSKILNYSKYLPKIPLNYSSHLL